MIPTGGAPRSEERCWYYHRTLGQPPERCALRDGHEPARSSDGRGGGHLYPSMTGSAWADADHPECAFYGHSPNAAGTECEMCGLPAEAGDPDELAEALTTAYETLTAQVEGQTQWLG